MKLKLYLFANTLFILTILSAMATSYKKYPANNLPEKKANDSIVSENKNAFRERKSIENANADFHYKYDQKGA